MGSFFPCPPITLLMSLIKKDSAGFCTTLENAYLGMLFVF